MSTDAITMRAQIPGVGAVLVHIDPARDHVRLTRPGSPDYQILKGDQSAALLEAIESYEHRVGTAEHALLRRLGLLLKPDETPEPLQLVKLFQEYTESEKEKIERMCGQLETRLSDEGHKPAVVAAKIAAFRGEMEKKLPNLRGYTEQTVRRINEYRRALAVAKDILGRALKQ